MTDGPDFIAVILNSPIGGSVQPFANEFSSHQSSANSGVQDGQQGASDAQQGADDSSNSGGSGSSGSNNDGSQNSNGGDVGPADPRFDITPFDFPDDVQFSDNTIPGEEDIQSNPWAIPDDWVKSATGSVNADDSADGTGSGDGNPGAAGQTAANGNTTGGADGERAGVAQRFLAAVTVPTDLFPVDVEDQILPLIGVDAVDHVDRYAVSRALVVLEARA